MGTITSGTGLISGLDIQDIVDQLIAIEARPRQLVQERIAVLNSQKTAFQDISSRLLALKGSSTTLGTRATFGKKSVTTSTEGVLTASANNDVALGTYSFTVDRLVSNNTLISRGFADADTKTFGTATTLRFESARARLDDDVRLSRLNGAVGVQRGYIRVTDRSGANATVDLSKAITLRDVVTAINNATGVSVVASIDGDGLKLTDTTGATTSNLIVENVGTFTTASDLGLAQSVAADELIGTSINTISADTALGLLNDGNGVSTASGDDFSITLGADTFNVNISTATTLGDVIDTINDAADNPGVTAAVAADGVSLQLTGAGQNASGAAADLGIEGTATNTLDGSRLVAKLNSKLLKNLNGGSGLELSGSSTLSTNTPLAALFNGAGVSGNGNDASPDLFVQDRTGATYNVEVDGLSTVGDLISAFNTATGGAVTLSIDGQSLKATNSTSGLSSFQISDQNGASVASDLGITINSPLLGPDSVTGNDTQPATSTSLSITNRAGAVTAIDLTGAESVVDVIDLINAAGAGVTASLNTAGNGLKITDNTGAAVSNLIVTDASGGTLASQLGIETGPTGVAETFYDGADVDLRYIAAGTRLDTLNAGAGVAKGKFTITASDGQSATIDLTQGNETTIASVIAEINSKGIGVTASINATGDGLRLTDSNGGGAALTVTEAGSSTARDLGILGSDTDLDGVIDGSFEKTIDVAASDTLNSLVAKINDADIFAQASLINDGSGVTPYRLSISSANSGVAGRLIFDDGGLNLGSTTLVRGDDAVVFFSSEDPTQSLLITSSTNSLKDTIAGVDIELLSSSDAPVEVTVQRNLASITESAQAFVDGFNDALDQFDEYDSYNAETKERGLLLGDPTLGAIRRRLFNAVNSRADVEGQFHYLTEIGISVGSGARLQFNEAKFLAALEADFDGVIELFSATTEVTSTTDVDLPDGVTIPSTTTDEPVGFGKLFEEILDRLTNELDGTVTRKTNTIDAQVEQGNKRIEQLNALLAKKRERLEAQFYAMEQALAQVQSQQTALSQLQSLAAATANQNN